MKMKTILYGIIVILFLTTFFFKIIPVPLENIAGSNNPDKFIYGGMVWTSLLSELAVKNFVGVLAFLGIFITISGGIYLIK